MVDTATFLLETPAMSLIALWPLVAATLFSPSQADLTIEIRGAEDSPHYMEPLIATLTNDGRTTATVDWAVGMQFTATDPSAQDFLLTAPVVAQLPPGSTRTVRLAAMCMERSDRAPNADDAYQPSGPADGILPRLAALIHARDDRDFGAQSWVWALAEDDSLRTADIDDLVLTDDDRLLLRMGDVERSAIPQADPVTAYKAFRGSFTLDFARPFDVHIALFDEHDIAQMEIYRNERTPTGHTDIEYEFNSHDVEPGTYFIRLIADGRVMVDKEVEV